ncbi:PREDICTED: uncharacterized protein LOC106807509 [Priapulus caudatus]|uniref:Uncharacterized protein LOC106807509 n=1 Tax=Priapulus caudatus TaxID=37621 RepID=A0ABM1DZG6_PRICU|nr:PREDICTED: uncharacterized protein LOC106807509 [Priapulus caudatus]
MDVHLLALPAHTTHFLQPLDRSFFGPLKQNYNAVCTKFIRENPDKMISKWVWPSLFRGSWLQNIAPLAIANGFRATGLYPFSPSAIPEAAFMPYDLPAPFHDPTAPFQRR